MTAPLTADEQVDVSDVAEIVGTRLADGDWGIGVFLTDLPSRMERSPVSTEVEPEHGVALISLPALGTRRLRSRLRQAVVGVVRQRAAQDEEPLARRRRQAPGEDEVSRGPTFTELALRWETDGRLVPGRPDEEWAILVGRHA
ncbi:hypothetical protein ACFTY8_38120 [Streptomyces mirabilis]|uniref:hypothetical protein n=1 Tax=Streptomyces mirabilis TaxID=68239 RepID=UPI00362B0F87